LSTCLSRLSFASFAPLREIFCMPPRQTQSYLRRLFDERGIAPRHRLGQNFLIDLNIHELIAATAEVGPGDAVLEVGPGAGALTSLLAGRGAAVVAVEFDPRMVELAREAVADQPHVRVLHADALAGKNTINPAVIDEVREARAAAGATAFKLVANLPYSVATPVITNVLVHPTLLPERMVVTIQRELAERMVAPPSSPPYGSLSVIVQALAEVSIVRILPPSVFWPRPKVESAVVMIRPVPARRAALDVPWFHAIVRKLFLHRRKNLRHVLSGLWPAAWPKADVDAWLKALDLDGQRRAEELTIDQFRALAEALKVRQADHFGAGAELAGSKDEAD
jgi:16S rRNA (adenine1518-N6/adenine1519-N6)-dimethyltransferase